MIHRSINGRHPIIGTRIIFLLMRIRINNTAMSVPSTGRLLPVRCLDDCQNFVQLNHLTLINDKTLQIATSNGSQKCVQWPFTTSLCENAMVTNGDLLCE